MVATRARESQLVRPTRSFHHRPIAPLQAYVERIWGWDEPQALHLPLVAPGLGAELFFHHGEPFRTSAHGSERKLDLGHLLCVRAAPLSLRNQRAVAFTAVRIRAGALGRFTPIPVRELRDTQLGVADIWGSAGAELANRVAEAGSREARVQLIEQFLCKRLALTAADPLVERALQLIYRGSLSVAQLAEQCGLGRRQLERRMGRYFGQTVVELRCLARFYHVARRLAVDPAQDALQAALAAGYYDQAHFIHEFKRFSGMTPEGFKRTLASATHFYNPVFRARPT